MEKEPIAERKPIIDEAKETVYELLRERFEKSQYMTELIDIVENIKTEQAAKKREDKRIGKLTFNIESIKSEAEKFKKDPTLSKLGELPDEKRPNLSPEQLFGIKLAKKISEKYLPIIDERFIKSDSDLQVATYKYFLIGLIEDYNADYNNEMEKLFWDKVQERDQIEKSNLTIILGLEISHKLKNIVGIYNYFTKGFNDKNIENQELIELINKLDSNEELKKIRAEYKENVNDKVPLKFEFTPHKPYLTKNIKPKDVEQILDIIMESIEKRDE